MHLARPRPAIAPGLALVVLLAGWSAGARSEAVRCSGVEATVTAPNPRDVVLACAAAAGALDFMRAHGIDTDVALAVEVSDEPAAPVGPRIGHFDARTRRVQMVSSDLCSVRCEHPKPFGIPVDRALYSSFVVHEIAHAVAYHNFRSKPGPVAAQEYIAYVVQIATMAPAVRAAVLRQHDLEAFAGPEEISALYYQLNPDAFAVKCYRHFAGLDDPGGFLRGVLSGAIRFARDGSEE